MANSSDKPIKDKDTSYALQWALSELEKTQTKQQAEEIENFELRQRLKQQSDHAVILKAQVLILIAISLIELALLFWARSLFQ